MHFYEYIYDRLYAWNHRLWGASDGPQYNACLGLSLLSVVNVFSMLLVSGITLPFSGALFALGVFAVSLVAHYLHFVRGGHYLVLNARFQADPPLPSRAGLALALAYVVGSIALFLTLLATRSANAAA